MPRVAGLAGMVRDRMLDSAEGGWSDREAGDPCVEQVRVELGVRCHLASHANLAPAGVETIGIMSLSGPNAAARASARSWTRKTSGCARLRRMPRTPRNGFDSPCGVRPGMGLSPPASRVRMVTGLPAAHPIRRE